MVEFVVADAVAVVVAVGLAVVVDLGVPFVPFVTVAESFEEHLQRNLDL